MQSYADIRPAYSSAERMSDGVVHVIGLVMAGVAVPLLIIFTVIYRSDPAAVLGASIYGVTLLIMLGFSALYNMARSDQWIDLLQRLDHSGIYVKIAGTYTPFLLLSGVQLPGLLIGLWSSAVLGSALKLLNPNRFRYFGLALYLLMGWAIVWAGHALLAELSPSILVLMFTGGITYTLGVVFYLLHWLPFHNTIWHVFVLAGTGLFFAAVALRIELVVVGNV